MPLQPHEERVIAERAELEIKRQKLAAFIQGAGAFEDLDAEDQKLLRRQEAVMLEYTDVLNDRISRFTRQSS